MNQTKFIAHRGFSRFEKENTLASFTAAGAQKEFYGIETDVHVTTDNHFIVIHDENPSRVTNGKVNINLEENTFATARSIKLPDIDNYEGRTDLRIPEMIEYFRICKKYNKVAVCELKQLFTKEQIAEILKIVDSIGMLENTIFISFYLEDLIKIREISQTQAAQWLLCEYKEEHMADLLKYHLDVDAQFASINKERVEVLHKNNIKVNVWTVDYEEDAKRLVEAGVDYITSNWIKEI